MVWSKIGIAILLTGLVATVAIRPASRNAQFETKIPSSEISVAAKSRLDDAERQAERLAAAFPAVTSNDGPDSMAVREARVGSFFCGYPEKLAGLFVRQPPTAFDDDETQRWLNNLRVKRLTPSAAILEEFQPLIVSDHDEVLFGPPAEHGGFYCGYPPQLVFGFHVPARIDAGLRWCFDCGAWQPCACPRSVVDPWLRWEIDDFYRREDTLLDRIHESSRSLATKLEALRNAIENIEERARANVEATDPELFLRRCTVPARRSGRFADAGPMIKSAFGILIPDSVNWPTIERYFAKPFPGSALPDQRPATTQGTP